MVGAPTAFHPEPRPGLAAGDVLDPRLRHRAHLHPLRGRQRGLGDLLTDLLNG
jgi:hypothetical protein